MRFNNLCACIIFLTFISCNNNTAETKKHYPEKEQQLKNLITRYPDSILLKENLIQYFRENGNYGAAIATTNEALNKDSLNDRFLDIKATLSFENGDTINAIRAFEKAIAINPQPEYIISLGSLYAQNEEPDGIGIG
jgi:tetratricopeptide (TPR) repeat protein